jgi:hypothetical protein
VAGIVHGHGSSFVSSHGGTALIPDRSFSRGEYAKTEQDARAFFAVAAGKPDCAG